MKECMLVKVCLSWVGVCVFLCGYFIDRIFDE